MLLADERHDFIRTFYSDLRQRRLCDAGEDPSRDGAEATASCATRRRGAADSISTCAMWARNSRCRYRWTLEQLQAGDWRNIRAAFDALYDTATPIILR